MINQTRQDKREYVSKFGGDIGLIVNRLSHLKLTDDRWDFAVHTKPDGTVSRLWWINPYQRTLAGIYGDILVLDVSEGRNLYDYYLTSFIVVDGEGNSRNIAHAVSEQQDEHTFCWIFRQMNKHLSISKFIGIFTDRGTGIDPAIREVWPNIFHGLCLWHIQKNITENLSGLLNINYVHFKNEFWEVYRMGSPDSFEIAWQRLLNNWPEAVTYLMDNLYPDKEKWAWAWVGTRFLAGIKTTSRVEAEHKHFKQIGLGRGINFNELFDILTDRSQEQKDQDFLKRYRVRRVLSLC